MSLLSRIKDSFSRKVDTVEDAEQRSWGARVPVGEPLCLRVGDVILRGTARDISLGGLFFATEVLLEEGARGMISRPDRQAPVNVRVAWVRASTDPMHRGLGLAFDA